MDETVKDVWSSIKLAAMMHVDAQMTVFAEHHTHKIHTQHTHTRYTHKTHTQDTHTQDTHTRHAAHLGSSLCGLLCLLLAHSHSVRAVVSLST